MFELRKRAFLFDLPEIPNVTRLKVLWTSETCWKKLGTALLFGTSRTLEVLKNTCDSFWCSLQKTNDSCGLTLSGHATTPFSLPTTCSGGKSTVFSLTFSIVFWGTQNEKNANLTELTRCFRKGNRTFRARGALVSKLKYRKSTSGSLGKLILAAKTASKVGKLIGNKNVPYLLVQNLQFFRSPGCFSKVVSSFWFGWWTVKQGPGSVTAQDNLTKTLQGFDFFNISRGKIGNKACSRKKSKFGTTEKEIRTSDFTHRQENAWR